MKKLALSLITPIFFICFLLISSDLQATHAAGMEIRYRHVSGDTYSITATFYRDCSATFPEPNTLDVRVRSQSLGINQLAGSYAKLFPQGIRHPGLLNCISNTARSRYCYEEFVYRGTFSFSGAGLGRLQADDWIFSAEINARPFSDNITGGTLYTECGLNNKDFPNGNNSLFWHTTAPDFPSHPNDTIINHLVRTLCADNFYTFDQEATDYDTADSISYEFARPLIGFDDPATYRVGYSLANPFPFNPAFPLTINSNGIIDVMPTLPPANEDRYVISIKATEWRNVTRNIGGALVAVPEKIGFGIRDMTLIINSSTECRRDSVHLLPKDVTCGDSIVSLNFGEVGDRTEVRCETISSDGTEFRVGDFTDPNKVRYIGVLESNWRCRSGKTNEVLVSLTEPLLYGRDYRIFLKKGTDLDVLESECGFLEPEFSGSPLVVGGVTPVDLGLPPAMAICLPQKDPFPLLTGTSADAVQYHWTLNGDTIKKHEINTLYADVAGSYEVLVRGPYGCPGSDKVDLYFPENKEFVFDFPPFCDEFTDKDTANHYPDILSAPSSPSGGTWQWEYDFGALNGFGVISTTQDVATIGAGLYRLSYTDIPVAPGVAGCVTEHVYELNRSNVRPDAPLDVEIFGDPVICAEGSDDAVFWINESLLKPNFKAKPGYGPNTPYTYQWFTPNGAINGATDSTFANNSVGTYYVLVEDAYGCYGIDTLQLQKVAGTPAFEVFCEVLSGKRGRFYWYDIPFATSYEVSLDQGLTWSPTQETSFEIDDIRVINGIKVKAILSNACKESDISDSYPCAAQVFPPNIFTPNKDGLNDVFFIGSLDLFPGSAVKIIDRWGTTVFESDDYKNDWKGGDAPEGTYYYIINVNDPVQSVYKGVITLLR